MIGGGDSGGTGSVPLFFIILAILIPIIVIACAIVFLSIRGKAKQREAEKLEAPAGWHVDPTNPGIERYWDGEGWTAHERPAIPENPTRAS